MIKVELTQSEIYGIYEAFSKCSVCSKYKHDSPIAKYIESLIEDRILEDRKTRQQEQEVEIEKSLRNNNSTPATKQKLIFRILNWIRT